MAMKLDHDDLDRLIEKISTSDIQEFSLEGEDFKLEIKRNLSDQNKVINNLVSNTSFDKQTIANQKTINDNIPTDNELINIEKVQFANAILHLSRIFLNLLR